MIDPSIVTGVGVSVVGIIGTWITSRRINASNARKTDRDGERDDFLAYRDTWSQERKEMREELASLRDRVSGVEAKLVDEQRDSEALVDAIRMLLAWIRAQFPDHTPPLLPQRVQQRIKEIA